MSFRPSDLVGLIWHHPILSGVVLLLFTPPLFPVVVYFSPLLISTALFVLAMISMGSDHEDESNTFSNDIAHKRVWTEEGDVDGPVLEGERVPKRLKATSSKDASWLDKMKNWEGAGRAWVESVLSQEAKITFGPDDNAASRDGFIPLLDKTREFFSGDVRKRSREAQDVPKTRSKPIGVAPTVASSNDSAPPVNFKKGESDVRAPRAEGVDSAMSSSEIRPDLGPEDVAEIAPAIIPSSPLFKSKFLPREDIVVQKEAADSVGSLQDTDCKDGKRTVSSSHSNAENDSAGGIIESKTGERARADADASSNSLAIPSPIDALVTEESNLSSQVSATRFADSKPDIGAASSGISSIDGADRNVIKKAQTTETTEDDGGKSAAELLRQQHASSYGLGTPSAAVALSDKLKVPLADIMSLLAGEDNETSGVKIPSPSETTTTSSQEEEWSGSDVESTAPPTLLPGKASVAKDG